MWRRVLITCGLLSGCFALAVSVEPRMAETRLLERHERAPVEVLLGDARRLFAGHFFVKADVYFHSGYYPSMFDQASMHQESHIASGAGAVAGGEHEEEVDFLGKPVDLIDRFSRSFFPSTHTHLDAEEPEHGHEHETAEEHAAHSAPEKVREMLPWLKVTAALDPNRIETYTVGAYWLRTRLKKPDQAEEFLRDGLAANPRSYAILFELGRIYSENFHDAGRARNVWEAALTRWKEQEEGKAREQRDEFLLLQIVWHLALLEQEAGNFDRAITHLEIARTVSPHPDRVQQRIDEVNRLRRAKTSP